MKNITKSDRNKIKQLRKQGWQLKAIAIYFNTSVPVISSLLTSEVKCDRIE